MIICIEDITMYTRRVIALKNDTLEFVKKHDDEFSVYRNLRTGELFITRITKVKETDEVGALIFAIKEKKTGSHKKKTAVATHTNQASLF